MTTLKCTAKKVLSGWFVFTDSFTTAFAFAELGYMKKLNTLHVKLVANEGNLLDLSVAGCDPVLAHFLLFLPLFLMLSPHD